MVLFYAWKFVCKNWRHIVRLLSAFVLCACLKTSRMIHFHFRFCAAPVIYHYALSCVQFLAARQKTTVMCFSVSHCDWDCAPLFQLMYFPLNHFSNFYSCNFPFDSIAYWNVNTNNGPKWNAIECVSRWNGIQSKRSEFN